MSDEADEPDGVRDEPKWSNYSLDAFTPQLKIELSVADAIATAIAHTIFHSARAKTHGSTAVIVLPLEELIEITTDERMT